MKLPLVNVLLIVAEPKDAADIARKLADAKKIDFAVQRAGLLSQALKLAQKKKFDVVLLDPAVPDMQGMRGFRELISVAPETSVVFISDSFNEEHALEAVRAGAEEYLSKNRINAAALERVLLYSLERRRARKNTAMQYSVSRVLAQSGTLGEVGVGLVEALCGYLDCDCGQVWRVDRWTGDLTLAQAWHKPSRPPAELLAASRPLLLAKGSGLAGRCWESAAPLWTNDLARDEPAARAEASARDAIHGGYAFPIMVGPEILGVVELFTSEAPELDAELLKALANIGTQIGQFMARKLAEEEKENVTNERLLILDSASEGIYGIDLTGRLTFINRSAAKMFGYEPSELLGKNSHEAFHHTRPDGSAYPMESCPVYSVVRSGQGCHIDSEYFWRKDGSHFAVEYSSFPVLKGGENTGAVVCFNDITARKRMDVELRHAQKLESVGALAAGIAHEINTPIQFIGDNTRFLQDSFRDGMELFNAYKQICEETKNGPVDPRKVEGAEAIRKRIDWDYLEREMPKAMEQMLDGVNRVATIVRAMKEFSHVDRSAEKTPADLNKALEGTLVVARNELKYVAEVETSFEPLPPVVCHLGDLNQVFLNLLVNAAHAIGDVVKGTQAKGLIRVRARQDGDFVEVAIQDSGTGIPDEIKDKVFDPFFTTKEVGKGTGQGLALARAIVVEKHGGTLNFETEIGKGTTFFVRLPINGVRSPREAVTA
jgi:PAS domain S-box-containing protein